MNGDFAAGDNGLLGAHLLPPTQRTMGVLMHSLVHRVSMALGPLLSGVLVDARGASPGVRLAFIAALALAAITIGRP